VPTEVTPDGSPVVVYRRLPPAGEAELIDRAVGTAGSILELGCGAGRITHGLVRLGHPVTAVDESREMLDRVRGAERVQASIEQLDLGRTFDAVVLASHFVNEPDPERRLRLLETCARHTSPEGSVLVESYPVDLDWQEALQRTSVHGDVSITLRNADLDGAHVDAVVEYSVDGRSWRQRFSAQMLDETDLAAALRAAGLDLVGWLDERRTWSRARPCENRAL
jgi:SAM-dependent methyltransferase